MGPQLFLIVGLFLQLLSAHELHPRAGPDCQFSVAASYLGETCDTFTRRWHIDRATFLSLNPAKSVGLGYFYGNDIVHNHSYLYSVNVYNHRYLYSDIIHKYQQFYGDIVNKHWRLYSNIVHNYRQLYSDNGVCYSHS
ncbi:hypothetical protein F9C07_2226669 [Aspergillus flavus]|uniref:Uncharacterized protein n=1 Tax=Aspergillus flavus (strain ATCC 200026 / FGSC A1120 / IAM 13836 / NRRL 3357 / JCM 12722 / SRRC 167) TaxID=332952 RepID=A0A7U2MGD6_ASPFN|nr:hypothetical protein AFLA_000370 [Aspergillus flavus NRRL3357]KAJ1711913.1 hypothetical protein NYO67_5942 [Aspergillus flavus]QRD83167.1 hypothetical protein F9C07_2226669 [Aspergillus flavus]